MECKMHSLLIFVSYQIPYLYPVYEVSLHLRRLKAKCRVLGMREEQHIFVSEVRQISPQSSEWRDFTVLCSAVIFVSLPQQP